MAVPLEEGSAGHEVDRLESVVVRQIRGKLSQVIVGHRFAFLVDEALEIGGTNLAPNPVALLLAGLGT